MTATTAAAQTAAAQSEETTHTVLRAKGFSCPSCVRKIEKQVGALDGVEDVKVEFATQKVLIDHSAAVSVDSLVDAVRAAGYESTPAQF